MWDYKILALIYKFVIKNDIQIQCPRSPVDLALPIRLSLNHMQQVKQFLRIKERLKRDTSV